MDDFTTQFFAEEQATFTSMPEPADGKCCKLEDEASEEAANSAIGSAEIFQPLPLLPAAIITWSFFALSLVLNSLVFRHYFWSQARTKVYVLALIVLDLFSIVFNLVPKFVLYFVTDRAAFVVLSCIRFFTVVVLFGSYLYPSLFLALDRFLAVYFPHKFHLLFGRVRVGKIIAVSLNVAISSTDAVCTLLFGIKSSTALLVKAVNWLFLLTQLIVSVVLYVAIVVQLLTSSNKLAGCVNNRLKSDLRCNHVSLLKHFSPLVHFQRHTKRP